MLPMVAGTSFANCALWLSDSCTFFLSVFHSSSHGHSFHFCWSDHFEIRMLLPNSFDGRSHSLICVNHSVACSISRFPSCFPAFWTAAAGVIGVGLMSTIQVDTSYGILVLYLVIACMCFSIGTHFPFCDECSICLVLFVFSVCFASAASVGLLMPLIPVVARMDFAVLLAFF